MASADPHPWQIAALPMIEPEFLANVLAASSDIAVIVDASGTVVAALANPEDAPYGDLSHWVGRRLTDFLTVECVPKFERLLRLKAKPNETLKLELNHKDRAIWQFPVRYSAHHIGHEGAILMIGHDLRKVAESQQQLVRAQLALEQGYEERREYDARYRMLMSATREAFVLVSVSDGRIRDLNAPAATLLGDTRDELLGSQFSREFPGRGGSDLVQNLLALALSEVDAEVTFQTKRTRRDLSLTPTSFRAGGERMLICKLDPEDTAVRSDDLLGENLNALFRNGSDAIVFTDEKGVIETANEAFLDLVDFAVHAEVRGRNIGDYMARGQIDLNVLLDNAVRSGHMRVYSTRLSNDVGVWTSVEVSVSYLNNRPKPSVAFVFRDATRAEAMRVSAESSSEIANNGVRDLVGSAALKEIVSQTTDVIERLCIETAIELTANNRAAAAEMLGLSRQSLYVKLHKYGLQEKPEDN